MALGEWLVNLGFGLAMETFGRHAHASLLRSAEDPRLAQARTLRSILRASPRPPLRVRSGSTAMKASRRFA